MSRTREFVAWLGEGAPLWAFLGTIALWLLVRRYFSNCLDPQFRLLGALLQIYGVWIVYLGLKDKSRLFGGDGMYGRWSGYFGRIPLRRRKISLAAMAVTEAADGFAGRAVVRANPHAPLQERLSRLEESFDRLFAEVGEISERLLAETRSLEQRIMEEAQTRNHEIEALSNKLEAATAGGLHIDLFGLVSGVLAGTIIGALSPELAALMGDASCQVGPVPGLKQLFGL